MQFKTAFLVVSNTGSVDSWHCGKCNHVGRAPIMRRLGSWPLLKICRRVTACLDSPNMSHSFTQNRCWTTLQAPQHEGWKTCVKNGRLNQFFEAPETVWWLGPTDPTLPPDFTTDLCCRLLVISRSVKKMRHVTDTSASTWNFKKYWNQSIINWSHHSWCFQSHPPRGNQRAYSVGNVFSGSVAT